VRRDEPGWWYGPTRALLPRLLAPASHVWARIAEQRLRRAQPYRCELPVICVGNFTAGGTGKTPLTREIAARLTKLGRTPVVLSRGYGGTVAGPHLVDPARDTAREVGDEPMLHAAHGPVVVARDRAAGVRLIEPRRSPSDVIVMDDGLQNPGLAKDLSIAVVDGGRGIGNGRVMPAGPLRARLGFQLGLVQVIVVVAPPPGRDIDPFIGELRKIWTGPILEARVAPAAPLDGLLRTGPIVAWAGIGAPDRFFDLLRAHGADLVHTATFPDHHVLDAGQARRLLATADTHAATLVTTEKDQVRLRGASGSAKELATRSRVVPITLNFDGPASDTLDGLLAAMLSRAASR
jgi:tetraacyldisaccharide 4'-kinase